MALMILAHPDFANSVSNKTIVESLQQSMESLEIRNIHQLYPNHEIDIDIEQQALLRHQFVILQYPMYWYNMPAILKSWFDQVFSYHFAYGSQGDKLKNKQLMVSMTVGQPEINFSMLNGISPIEQLLLPIKLSSEYAQMHYLQPNILFNTSTTIGNKRDEIIARAKQYSQKFRQTIDQFYI